jgi:hypothetical protein
MRRAAPHIEALERARYDGGTTGSGETMRIGVCGLVVLWVGWMAMGVPRAVAVADAAASVATGDECAEGAEFIGNAARARDNGMSREAFLARMRGDFAAIRAFPPELRWFVHDAADEAFLYAAARDVFDHPESPEVHQVAFFGACLNRNLV